MISSVKATVTQTAAGTRSGSHKAGNRDSDCSRDSERITQGLRPRQGLGAQAGSCRVPVRSSQAAHGLRAQAGAVSESPRRRSSVQQSLPGWLSESAVYPGRDSGCQAGCQWRGCRTMPLQVDGRATIAHRLLVALSHHCGCYGRGAAQSRGWPCSVEGRERSSAQEVQLGSAEQARAARPAAKI